MKISVVTVCLNSEKTIAHTIASFLEQTYPNKEMVVVDGASTDRTLEIVRNFANPAIRVISEKDAGIYDAMNKGLRAYSGNALGFLNADDKFHDATVLERIAGGLAEADAVYGDIVFVTDHAAAAIVRIWRAGLFRRGSFRRGWMPPHPTVYVRRALADAVGPFDLRYNLSSDYDYVLRAFEVENSRVTYIPHTLVDFMQGGSSTKSLWRYVQGNLDCLRSRRDRLGAPPLDFALILKPLLKAHQFRRPS